MDTLPSTGATRKVFPLEPGAGLTRTGPYDVTEFSSDSAGPLSGGGVTRRSEDGMACELAEQ